MTSVSGYQQYREYLRDFYEDQKRRKTGFTYARFSAAAGIASPNYYKLVMDGQKNLTPENVIRFARALRLADTEADYFEALVYYNQARKPLERDFYYERLKRLKKRAQGVDERTLEQDEFDAVSSWVHHAILVLTKVRGFRESPAWIRERLFGLVTEAEVSAALERLLALGMLVRDEEGRLKPSARKTVTKPEVRRMAAKIFYEGLLKRAVQALDLTEPEERELGAYLVTLSPKQVPELKRRVREVLDQLSDWALENDKPLQVYALTFAGFPVTSLERRHSQ